VADPTFRRFMRASRDRYPAWIHWLAERTGIEVTLNLDGIVEIQPDPAGDGGVDEEVSQLGPGELRQLEPALAGHERAAFHQNDGYVDNVTLLRALREAVRCEWSIDFVDGRGASVGASRDGCSVRTEDGRTLRGGIVVLAAGAWSSLVAGLPRYPRVEPVRGQMLLLDRCPLSHAVSSPDAYLVPRDGRLLVGSTLERVGFDSRTTDTAREHLRNAALAAVPGLAEATIARSWAGLRPMTPDGRPILGPDPDTPTVVYACGHGKNGILLAPLTAECVAAAITREPVPFDLGSFAVTRFS
jgi:glycine oxidase